MSASHKPASQGSAAGTAAAGTGAAGELAAGEGMHIHRSAVVCARLENIGRDEGGCAAVVEVNSGGFAGNRGWNFVHYHYECLTGAGIAVAVVGRKYDRIEAPMAAIERIGTHTLQVHDPAVIGTRLKHILHLDGCLPGCIERGKGGFARDDGLGIVYHRYHGRSSSLVATTVVDYYGYRIRTEFAAIKGIRGNAEVTDGAALRIESRLYHVLWVNRGRAPVGRNENRNVFSNQRRRYIVRM